MAKRFSAEERKILDLFSPGVSFIFDGRLFTVDVSGKPTCGRGEPKTDIYIGARSFAGYKEFKISFKQSNANFLENKTNSDRAEQLFGPNWKDIITDATQNIKDLFESRKLIFKNSYGKTSAGAITLGWKFELLNVMSGQLSGSMLLSRSQVVDVYAGTNLSIDKKNALLNGITIPNCGVANYILFEDHPVSDAQDAIDSLITIEQYVDTHPDVFFACKALNYRSFENKYDGDRPLSVYVDWHIKQGKLAYDICYDTPLQQGGNQVYSRLSAAMRLLNISSTKDIDSDNVENPRIIYQ